MDNNTLSKYEIVDISDKFIKENYKELVKEIQEEGEELKHSLQRIQSEVFEEIEKLNITSEEHIKKHIKEIIPIVYWKRLEELKISPIKAEKLLGGFPKNIPIDTRKNTTIYRFDLSQKVAEKRGRVEKIIIRGKKPKGNKTINILKTNYNAITNIIKDIKLLRLDSTETIEPFQILEKYQKVIAKELKKRGKPIDNKLVVYDYTKSYGYHRKIKSLYTKIDRLSKKKYLLTSDRFELVILKALDTLKNIIDKAPKNRKKL